MPSDIVKALDHWLAIQERYDTNIVSYRNPGVTNAELDAVETRLDIDLPTEVRDWFKWADGFAGPYGAPYFLLASSISTYSLQTAADEFGTFDYDTVSGRCIYQEQVKHAPNWGQHREVRKPSRSWRGTTSWVSNSKDQAPVPCSFGDWMMLAGRLAR